MKFKEKIKKWIYALWQEHLYEQQLQRSKYEAERAHTNRQLTDTLYGQEGNRNFLNLRVKSQQFSCKTLHISHLSES